MSEPEPVVVRALRAVCRLLLRVFFRRIEVTGLEHVPPEGRSMFVVNHPNGLVDPLFLLCFAGRSVSFLAKAPLFDMPIVRRFVRAFRCLPVYRSSDGQDPGRNRAMMKQASDLLASGGALALFPEGTSHSDPRLRPLRTGAARIALSASAVGGREVLLVPVGLHYSSKAVFRSSAWVHFGPPIVVEPGPVDDGAEAPREVALALTEALSRSLGDVVLQADDPGVLELAEVAERITATCERRDRATSGASSGLAARVRTRRELLDEHARLVGAPEVEALISRISGLRDRARMLAVPVDATWDDPPRRDLGGSRGRMWPMLVVPAGLGAVVHYPAYRAIGVLAFRYAGDETDLLATAKLLGGMVLFPVTWLVVFGGVAWSVGPVWAGLVAAALPPCGGATLVFGESWARWRRSRHLRRVARNHPEEVRAFERERDAIAREIERLR